MKKAEAAKLLSIEESEVHDVADSPAGTVVKTHDGATYIIVPEDNPDAEGRHGVMFLAAPHKNYGGTFPVYANPGIDVDEVEKRLGVDLDDPEPRPADPDIPAGSTDDVAHPGVQAATAEAHVASAVGNIPPSDAVPAPGPEHDKEVASAEATRPAEPVTVVTTESPKDDGASGRRGRRS